MNLSIFYNHIFSPTNAIFCMTVHTAIVVPHLVHASYDFPVNGHDPAETSVCFLNIQIIALIIFIPLRK
jgi:hypothetical protein